MKYLLDTNVISDARTRRSEAVADWLQKQLVRDLAISAVSILELERGVRQKERSDPIGARPLRQWLDDDVRAMFASRVLAVDDPVATRAATLHIPDPRPELDALIAATATVHDLVLVTRNVRDFRDTGVRVFDPWNA